MDRYIAMKKEKQNIDTYQTESENKEKDQDEMWGKRNAVQTWRAKKDAQKEAQ